ncbi:MAG: hypothetical protein HZY79_01610 [Rhodoblastus sp.]|nr:MAG: hypothetical protein HZY79_01610 [Rhodoblastus sp.]
MRAGVGGLRRRIGLGERRAGVVHLPSGGSAFVRRAGRAHPAVASPANAPQLRTCPEAIIVDGGAALRVGGPANQSVRHQFAITDVARECQPRAA